MGLGPNKFFPDMPPIVKMKVKRIRVRDSEGARTVYDSDQRCLLLEFRGKVPSHKNPKRPVIRKSGKPGLYTDKRVQEEMDRLALQIPGAMRDLNLDHPDMEFYFTVVHQRADRDSMVSCLLDLLYAYRVIRNDNVAHCNGKIVIHPAEIGLEWFTRVELSGWEEDPKPHTSRQPHKGSAST